MTFNPNDMTTWTVPTDMYYLFGVVCLFFLVAWYLNKPHKTKMGEGEMARYFRNARVRFIVGEGITEVIEDAVFKNKLSRAESIDVYNKIGRAFGLVDLLPKRPLQAKLSRGETEHLKEQILSRIKKQTTDNVEPLPIKRIRTLGKK